MRAIVLFVMIIHCIISFFYVRQHKDKRSMSMLVFFGMLPILGFLLYYIPLQAYQTAGKRSYDREGLVNRALMEKEGAMPEVKKELDIIPICDAMAVCNNSEKRNLLLDQMKKDLSQNYKALMLVGNDCDSESVHYIAAAKTEIYRRQQKQLIAAKKAHEEERESIIKAQHYFEELVKHINSGILSEKEAYLYRQRFRHAMGSYVAAYEQTGRAAVDFTYFRAYLLCCIRDRQYDRAQRLWNSLPPHEKDENSYFAMLGMHYENADKAEFYACLDDLCESDIELSAEGSGKLRFWKGRRG